MASVAMRTLSNAEAKSPLKLKTPDIYRPPHITPRIPAQRCVFTVHPNPRESRAPRGLVEWRVSESACGNIEDVPGHIVAIADQRGLTTLDTGEVSAWSTKVILDLTNGTGPHQSYTVTTFEDRSTAITAGKGFTTARFDGTATFEGTFTYVGGTSRFAGVKGEGSYRGKRMAPLTSGCAADLFMDYVATYTVPSQ
jgi:hypothetical protein